MRKDSAAERRYSSETAGPEYPEETALKAADQPAFCQEPPEVDCCRVGIEQRAEHAAQVELAPVPALERFGLPESLAVWRLD